MVRQHSPTSADETDVYVMHHAHQTAALYKRINMHQTRRRCDQSTRTHELKSSQTHLKRAVILCRDARHRFNAASIIMSCAMSRTETTLQFDSERNHQRLCLRVCGLIEFACKSGATTWCKYAEQMCRYIFGICIWTHTKKICNASRQPINSRNVALIRLTF